MAMPSPVLIRTERLVLTMPPPGDAARMVDYFVRNERHLAPWEPARPPGFYETEFWERRLEDNRRELAEDRGMRLVMFPRGDAARPVIGTVNYTSFVRGAFQACYLGYAVDGARQGRGLMFEALDATNRFVFDELGMHRVMANHLPENRRSARLLRRLGFETEGYARDYLLIDGQWRDHVLTALVDRRADGVTSAR